MTTKNQNIVEKLNQLLADYQIFYQNLRGLHWNIKGQMFFALHEKYEEYYNGASEVVDEIAERILMLGGQPLHTFGDYLEVAKLEQVVNITDGRKGVSIVLSGDRYFLKSFKEILEMAGENGDEGTAAMISEWIGATEKRIWMLESYLA
ncbi:MAG TPA: Dps family protein [Draconibacterium sp.]|nr:Dps family protein [Draconibacterium sp.]